MFLRRFSISTKLAILVGLAVVATAVTGWQGRSAVSALSATTERLVEHSKRTRVQMDADMIHDALHADVLQAIVADDEKTRASVRDEVADHAKAFHDDFVKLGESDLDATAKSRLATTAELGEKYAALAQHIVEIGTKDPAAARAALPDFNAQFARLETELESLGDALIDASASEQTGAVAGATRTLIVYWVVASVLLIAFSILVGRSIRSRLVHAVRVLEATADRDFTKRLDSDSDDEIGRMAKSLNRALDTIDLAFHEVLAVAGRVTDASTKLASSSEVISSGAHQQAASLEETAASLEEITATVKQSAGNAQAASQLASASRETAESGGKIVEQAVVAMNEVTQASRKIGDIITTIDEIALQTNLLALNAAVEAARAGEQGRGFAVVAAEVGNLAQRSAAAAKEVKALIQDAIVRVETGQGLVDRSGRALAEIITSVKKVTDIFGEIAAAAGEQSIGIDQVNEAVSQMDRVTQSNAAQTSRMSHTAESLATQATQLDELLARFTLSRNARPVESEPVVPRSKIKVESIKPRRAAAPAAPAKSHGVNGHAVNGPAVNGFSVEDHDDSWEVL